MSFMEERFTENSGHGPQDAGVDRFARRERISGTVPLNAWTVYPQNPPFILFLPADHVGGSRDHLYPAG